MPKRIDCDVEELRRLYFDERLNCAQVAEAVGWGAKRCYLVASKLRGAGYAIRPPEQRGKPWPLNEMRRLYVEEGLNSIEVGERVGCSPTHVIRLLRPLGVLRRRGCSAKPRSGPKAPSWKGGRIVLPTGYVMIRAPDHPAAMKSGYVLEHRMVAYDVYGEMTSRDDVHHINGVKDDNRPENLMVIRRGKHQHLHADIRRELYRLRREVERLAAAPKPASGIAGQHRGDDWKVVG